MELQTASYDDVLVLSPVGRIDHNTADAFKEALLPLVETSDAEHGKIALDMSRVDYMSSVGLRVLMMAAKAGKKLRREIVVAGLQPTMREIFEISRFDMVFQTYETIRDAVGTLSENALAAFDRS